MERLGLAYMLSGEGSAGLHFDARQPEEFLLTATRALRGGCSSSWTFRRSEADGLLGLFALQRVIVANGDGGEPLSHPFGKWIVARSHRGHGDHRDG